MPRPTDDEMTLLDITTRDDDDDDDDPVPMTTTIQRETVCRFISVKAHNGAIASCAKVMAALTFAASVLRHFSL